MHSRALYPKAQLCPIVPEELSRNVRHDAVSLVGESEQIPLAQILAPARITGLPMAISAGYRSVYPPVKSRCLNSCTVHCTQAVQ